MWPLYLMELMPRRIFFSRSMMDPAGDCSTRLRAPLAADSMMKLRHGMWSVLGLNLKSVLTMAARASSSTMICMVGLLSVVMVAISGQAP